MSGSSVALAAVVGRARRLRAPGTCAMKEYQNICLTSNRKEDVRDTGVERLAGALGGKPRAIRFALVSMKDAPTVAVAARTARAVENFIVN